MLIKSGNWLQIVTIAAPGGKAAAVPRSIFIALKVLNCDRHIREVMAAEAQKLCKTYLAIFS